MAYKKENMIKQCLEAIEENSLVFIHEIIAFVPFSEKTFYNYKLQELQDIENALNHNRITIKQELRKKWKNSNSPALQISLYRLIATPIEYECLTMHHIDYTSKGDKIQPLNINVVKDENVEKYKKHLDKLAKLN